MLQSFMQLRNLYNVKIFFANMNMNRLVKGVYETLKCDISLDDFKEIYKDATKKKYDKLVIDERNPTETVF